MRFQRIFFISAELIPLPARQEACITPPRAAPRIFNSIFQKTALVLQLQIGQLLDSLWRELRRRAVGVAGWSGSLLCWERELTATRRTADALDCRAAGHHTE